MATASPKLLDDSTLARLGILQGTGALAPSRSVLPLGWPELERVLPDRGFPRGVVELACAVTAPRRATHGAWCAGATTPALAAARAVHAKDAHAWCAWVTPEGAPSLYAPSVAQADVDLERLLVVRPERAALARTVVRVAASGAFDLVVVDAMEGLDGRLGGRGRGRSSSGENAALVVRKLSLASEEKGTTFVLLSNLYASRPLPWPVALRLEIERRPEAIAVRVAKDRRGAHELRSSPHVVRIAC
jgi:hypothetical protein